MKKPLRIVLVVVASLLLLVALVATLALTPGVQTWAARKFSPSTPALTVGIGSVDAGLHRTRVENIRVVQPGLVLTIPSAEIEVGVIDAAGGKVEVKRLVAKGWTLELTAPSSKPSAPSAPKPAEAARTAFNGLFNLIQLPFDLAVDGVDLSGEVILPEGHGPVSLTGGGIASGKDGKFTLAADLKTTDATALTVRGDLTARMATARTFDRFALAATASIKGPQLPKGAAISLTVSAATEGQGEAYALAVRTGDHDLVTANITLPPGTAPLAGSWKLDATTADAAPFASGRTLPDVIAKGQGAFSADRLFTQIQTFGSLDASIDKLASLQPEFAALGRLVFTAGFDVTTQGDVAKLNKLDVRLAGARPVLSAVALQAVSVNTKTRAVTAADPSSDLIKFTLDGLPLAWAKPFLGDLVVTGDDVIGGFTVSARDGGFAVRPSAPITVTNLSITQAGKPLAAGLAFSLSAQADYSPKGVSAEITDLTLRGAAAPLFKLTAKAAQADGTDQPLTVAGKFESDLAVVLTQPAAAGAAALKRGVARGEFTASAAKTKTATFTLQLADLVADNAASSPLPSVALQARADIDAAGRITAQIPVVITQAGRRSDLTLGAVVTTVQKETQINARLTGDLLNLPDLLLFSSLAPASPAPDSTPTPAPKPAPAKPQSLPSAPVWVGLSGELQIAIKTVAYSPQVQVTDIAGVVKLTPAALTWENLRAALTTGGTFKSDGGLQFDAKQAKPYALKGDVSLSNVEPAPILRAMSPKKPAALEGKFDLATQLSGRATEPAALAEGAVGDIHLTSKGGTLRVLSVRDTALADGVSKAAALVGLFGQLSGKAPNQDVEKVRAVADVAKQFSSIPYDRLNILAGRDEKNNFEIKDLSLVSPIIRLIGSGQVAYTPGVPFLRQPLQLTLKLGARDNFAESLAALKLIGGQADKDGYYSLTEDVKLDGSLQSIGTAQLLAMLKRALTN